MNSTVLFGVTNRNISAFFCEEMKDFTLQFRKAMVSSMTQNLLAFSKSARI